MDLEEVISGIEGCQTIDELKSTLQRICENFGFASFNFLDTGATHLDAPFHMGTLKDDFAQGYIDNKLIHVDPCISRARRTNTPFCWGDVSVQQYKGVRKSGALKTMEFAHDFEFQEGFIVPFHFSDSRAGEFKSHRVFWSDAIRKFKFLISRKKYEMHIIMIYWAQRAVDIVGEQNQDGARFAPKNPNNIVERDLTTESATYWHGQGAENPYRILPIFWRCPRTPSKATSEMR